MASIECPLHSLLTLAVHHLFHRLQTAIFSFIKNKRFSVFLQLNICHFADKKSMVSFFMFANHFTCHLSHRSIYHWHVAQRAERHAMLRFFLASKMHG